MNNRVLGVVAWGMAIVALAGLVLVEITRPLAPAVQAVDPTTFLDLASIRAAQAYRQPLRFAALLSLVLRAGTATAVLLWLRDRDTAAMTTVRRWRLLRVGLAGLAVWAAMDVVRLPVQIWAWDRSVDVGLSTQNFLQWFGDWVLQTIPYWIGVGLAVMGAAWLRDRLGRHWVPVAGVCGGVIGVVMIFVGPLLFEPLLFDFTPLPQGDLRDAIVQLLVRADEPADAQLLVADASRRTTTSNAYVSGLGGTRRIVLYDNLIDDAPAEEIVSIVAHELGHAQHHDIERRAIGLIGVSVLLVAAVNRLSPLHIVSKRPTSASMAARSVAITLILLVVFAPVEGWVSRRSEAAADARALEVTVDPDAYRSMMIGLGQRNLTDPSPPSWVVTLFYSHPPIGSRIARAASDS